MLVTPASSAHKQMNCVAVLQLMTCNDQDEGCARRETQVGRTMGQPIAKETASYRPVSQNVWTQNFNLGVVFADTYMEYAGEGVLHKIQKNSKASFNSSKSKL
jgi:ribosomal protein S25